MNVVKFPRKPDERLVWRCNCGCFTHYAHPDARIECAACGAMGNGCDGSWRLPLPDEPAEPLYLEPGDMKVTDLNSPELSLQRAFKTADPANIAALIIINKDGSTSCWSETFDTPERRDWFSQKLAEATAPPKN